MLSLYDQPTQLADLSWLAEVHDFAPPLEPNTPIWMRQSHAQFGSAIPRAERHPCCEICFIFEGDGVVFIEGQEARFAPGDLLLIGPGVPHWSEITHYPR